MKRILIAYVAASAFTLIAAPVGNQLLFMIASVAIPDAIAIMALWFAVVGIPSMGWAHQNLAAALHVRRPAVPELRVVNERNISVGSFADSVTSIFHRREVAEHLAIPDTLEFHYGCTVISEAEMFHFLAQCWRRQQRQEAPLSRVFWVNGRRLDRTGYDARIALLLSCDLILGDRRQGTRNRLRWAPSQTMARLKWRVVG